MVTIMTTGVASDPLVPDRSRAPTYTLIVSVAIDGLLTDTSLPD